MIDLIISIGLGLTGVAIMAVIIETFGNCFGEDLFHKEMRTFRKLKKKERIIKND